MICNGLSEPANSLAFSGIAHFLRLLVSGSGGDDGSGDALPGSHSDPYRQRAGSGRMHEMPKYARQTGQ